MYGHINKPERIITERQAWKKLTVSVVRLQTNEPLLRETLFNYYHRNGECPIACVGMTETEERHVYEDRPD